MYFSWSGWLHRQFKSFRKGRRSGIHPLRRRMHLEQLEERLAPATYTVTGAGDGAGAVVQTGPDTFTATTLRAAINATNLNPGHDTINFSIGMGAQTISVGQATGMPLPTIIDPVILDGTTQPGFAGMPLIELEGTNAGGNAVGLTITAGSSTVRGLVINRFNGGGVLLQTLGSNTIAGNFIGTDNTGLNSRFNVNYGIFINDVPDNIIGGTTAGDRNLISGNDAAFNIDGVKISGANAQNNRLTAQ